MTMKYLKNFQEKTKKKIIRKEKLVTVKKAYFILYLFS